MAPPGRRMPDSNSEMVFESTPLQEARFSIDIRARIRPARSFFPLNCSFIFLHAKPLESSAQARNKNKSSPQQSQADQADDKKPTLDKDVGTNRARLTNGSNGNPPERVRGIEPPSSAWKAGALPLSYTRIASALRRSGREDSNLRPPAPKAGALPGCATPRRDQNVV